MTFINSGETGILNIIQVIGNHVDSENSMWYV